MGIENFEPIEISADSYCDDCYYETSGRHCFWAQIFFRGEEIIKCPFYTPYRRVPEIREINLN